MSFRYRKRLGGGYTAIVEADDPYLRYIEFGVLRLGMGEHYSEETLEREVALIVLSGRCTVRCGPLEWPSLGDRPSVFAGRAWGAYIPPGARYEVIGEGEVEAAICRARVSQITGQPRVITPAEVALRSVGRENWRRDVLDIVGPQVEAGRLIIGETLNPPGHWSSSPPHKHDVDNPPHEAKLEELYFYKISPPQGFGIQRIYTDDGTTDENYTVEDNDVIVIPWGYHPVVAAPGYSLYYLWVLAGETRQQQWRDDPKHAWIKDQLPP